MPNGDKSVNTPVEMSPLPATVPQLNISPTVDWNYQLAFRKEVMLKCPDMDLPKYLLAPEIRALSELPINDHHRMLLRLLFNCGGRINEVLALTPSDILHVQDRCLVQLRTLKQQRRSSGRAKKGNIRLVPLFDTQFANELNRYIVTHCTNQRLPIFHSKRSKKRTAINSETARLWLKEIEQVAVENGVFLGTALTPHVLRHSFGMHLLLNHMHIKRVQALLGHARLSSTEVYTKILSIDVGERMEIQF